MKRIALVVVLVACGKADGGKADSSRVTGGCYNASVGECWEHPPGRDAKQLADICDNDPGATWLAACPREKLSGGCKSANQYDAGAPTLYLYKGSPDDVKKQCESDGQAFVAK